MMSSPSAPRAHELVARDDPQRPLPRPLLDARGGFAWWYVDLVDDAGNGVVVIWSYGLPFLPGYASAARRGAPERPGDRPSLNVAAYAGGKLIGYVLEEYPPDQAWWREGDAEWCFGRSRIVSALSGGRRFVDISLDCAVPGSSERLVGQVRVEGAVCRSPSPAEAALAETSPHRWTPLVGLAHGTASLRAGDKTWVHTRGRAYHDRNGGDRALHDLGIHTWLWGRCSFPGEELVYYALWTDAGPEPSTTLVWSLDEAGGMQPRHGSTVVGPRARARYGMPVWPKLGLQLSARSQGKTLGAERVEVERVSRVDDGPFYVRSLTRARRGGAVGHGVEEIIRPDRIDRAWERPLVRMRVHNVDRENSMWLPLFVGSSDDRLRRLARGSLERVRALPGRLFGLRR